MTDFAQHGPFLTLPCLNPSADSDLLHGILPELTQKNPLALVVPCLAADAAQAPLRDLLGSLHDAAWVHHIIIPINGLDRDEFDTISNGLLALHARLPLTLLHTDHDLPQSRPGKGTNVLNALRWLRSNAFNGVVALLDADDLAFRKERLARLVHPVCDRRFGIEFAKLFYSRFDQKLHGRVSRLFFEPLLRTISPLLPTSFADFLSAFRYPLAGECAFSMRFGERIRLPPGWGLEIALIAEAHRTLSADAICQVGSTHPHQHRHHHDPEHLVQQCRAILDTLASHPSSENRLGPTSLSTLRTTFAQAQLRAIRSSSLIALANGLTFATDSEFDLAQRFAQTLTGPRTHVQLKGISDP